MGVILWYQIEFPDQGVKVSNDVWSGSYIVDAEIAVKYGIERPGTFVAKLTSLPLDVTKALITALQSAQAGPGGGVPIRIHLGYFDLPKAVVLDGRVQTIDSRVRDGLVTTLQGYEKASYILMNTKDIGANAPPPRISWSTPVTAQQAVQDIVAKAGGVSVLSPVTPATTTFSSPHLEGKNAFDLLRKFAAVTATAEVLVHEGSVQFGDAVSYPPLLGPPSPPSPSSLGALLSGDDQLIMLNPFGNARLAKFNPLDIGAPSADLVATDLPAAAGVGAFDFTTEGVPAMRAGHLVVATVAEYADPFRAFRISELTHSYSKAGGYTCTGRAIRFIVGGSNRQQTQDGRSASAQAVAELLSNKMQDAHEAHPAIDVGRVKDSTPAKRVASMYYRQDFSPTKASPSVDSDISTQNVVLQDKPVASPFAFHKVGLVVPLYEGMRALIAQNRSIRQDAVVAGFLWSNDPHMDRPQGKVTDWWLCLPTGLDGQGLPTGDGANDLTAGDGRRVIETKGLRIRIGQGMLTAVGNRPTEGNADELVIEQGKGATITIKNSGDVEVAVAAGKTIKLTDGSTSLTLGNNAVKIA
jgi:hypothetical protein